jgi:hypothetical protein
MLLIRPISYMDSFNYAKHIVDHYNQNLIANKDPFFDFGHVLWRPLGFLLWNPLQGLLRGAFHGDDILAAGSVLIAMSIAGGFVGAVLLFLWIARSTNSAWAAGIATIGYISTNALLGYTAVGVAYVVGITCQIGALYLLQRALSQGNFKAPAGVLSGLVFGLSIVLWFPYVLAAVGIFCYALLAERPEHDNPIGRRATGLAGLVAGAAVIVALVYGCAIVMAGFTDLDSISQWISASRHDLVSDRGLLRMLGTGIPRSFFSLGEGNVAWKRLLFEGRTMPLGALIRTGIWKVGLVYCVLVSCVIALWRSRRGRGLLISLLALAIPLGLFTVFLYDPSPPERYLAAFPLLFLAFAQILADRQRGAFPKLLLGLFFVSMLAVNLSALSRFEAARSRVDALNERVLPKDKIILLSPQDEVFRLVNAQPFNSISRNRYCFDYALPWGAAHKELWRIRFASLTVSTWATGGRVWLSRRFLATSPEPAWGWVEGDLFGIRWQEISSFFRQLDFADPFGGSSDGFSEVARTPRNASLFQALTSASPH